MRVEAERNFWNHFFATHDTPYKIEPLFYIERFFLRRLAPLTAHHVLSVGGGFDAYALYLAQRGNQVTCVDISSQGLSQTSARARELGIADNLTVVECPAEECAYVEAFDAVIVHKALHHMDFDKAISAITRSLKKGAVLYAEEPSCIWPWLRAVHKRLPFHPDYPVLDTEHEITETEIAYLGTLFSKTSVHYFNCLTRPSLAYFLGRFHASWLIPPLSTADFYLIKTLFFLRYASSHVVIEAVK